MAKTVRIQDDLYHAVNGEWLEKAVIPDDRPTTGGFADLDVGVEKKLREDFAAFAEGKEAAPFPEMGEAVKLFKQVLDVARREKEGIKPLLPHLAKIADIKSVEELNAKAKELVLEGFDLPFNFGVEPNMKDTTRNSFIVLGPAILLPDTSYYQEGNQEGKTLLGVYAEMAKNLLALTPLSAEEQKKYVADTLAFDALAAKQAKSQIEWADYVDNYHPMPTEKVAACLAPLDLNGLLASFYGKDVPSEVIVFEPRAIENFQQTFNGENLEMYKHWAYVRFLVSSSAYLSEAMRELGGSFRRTLYGIAKSPVVEKHAYRTASSFFSEPVGVYYGRKYFGEEAKKDVVSLVKKIIATYKERMAVNSFLKEETKKKAILKLSTIEIKMGYPDKIDAIYGQLHVDESKSLIDNLTAISATRALHSLLKLNKPVDRSEWGMPGHMVNACYNPFANDITFPAAILQKPFYGIDQSVYANLGGIGAVIGHEISHAFDNNGASFDEKGNLANWWTEEDFAAFKALTKAMIEEFDGIDFYGGKVSGELIVSENIADNGGMGVTLGIMATMKDADYQEYFKNWARVWCLKARPAYIQLLLSSDVHAPAELRANIQPRNFDEWYAAFDVKATDKMYLPADKRVRIW